MKSNQSKAWMIVFFSIAFLCFIGFIIALVMEGKFGTWSGILFGLTALALFPGLIFVLVHIATSDDKVIRPSKKDSKDTKEKDDNQ